MKLSPGPTSAAVADELAAVGERHRPALIRLAAALTGDLDVAHDLAQDALVALLQHDDVLDPAAWLRTVVVNRARTWVRRQVRHRGYLQQWEVWRTDRGGDGVPLADQLAVRQALAGLSVDHRAALVLRYYDDLTVPEIARVLGVYEGTVKSRLHRALIRLKEAIADE